MNLEKEDKIGNLKDRFRDNKRNAINVKKVLS